MSAGELPFFDNTRRIFSRNEAFWTELSSLLDPISSVFSTVVPRQMGLIGLSLFANTRNASDARIYIF